MYRIAPVVHIGCRYCVCNHTRKFFLMRVRNSLKCLPITYKYSIVSIAASDTIKMAICHDEMQCTEFFRDFWSFFDQSGSKKLVTAYSGDP